MEASANNVEQQVVRQCLIVDDWHIFVVAFGWIVVFHTDARVRCVEFLELQRSTCSLFELVKTLAGDSLLFEDEVFALIRRGCCIVRIAIKLLLKLWTK